MVDSQFSGLQPSKSLTLNLTNMTIINVGKDYVRETMYDDLANRYISLEDKYYELAVLNQKNELEEFRKEYFLRKDKADQEIKQLDDKRAEYKAQMKHGLITNVEYQRLFMGLNKQKRAVEDELSRFKHDASRDIKESGFINDYIVDRFLEEGIPQNLPEERPMVFDLSHFIYRKALIRAAMTNKKMIKSVGKSIYILERTCLDNMTNCYISKAIAAAETKEEIITFCRSTYGGNISFDDNGKTPTIHTLMGEASFCIKEVVWLSKNNG